MRVCGWPAPCCWPWVSGLSVAVTVPPAAARSWVIPSRRADTLAKPDAATAKKEAEEAGGPQDGGRQGQLNLQQLPRCLPGLRIEGVPFKALRRITEHGITLASSAEGLLPELARWYT